MKQSSKILLSLLSGIVLLCITFFYLNSNFTLSSEEALYKKIAFFKFKLFGHERPQESKRFQFVNTARSLALIADTGLGTGQVAVADRAKLLHLFKQLREYNVHPAFIVLDIEFYYPFTLLQSGRDSLLNASSIDLQLQSEINIQKNVTTPQLFKEDEKITSNPVIHSAYPSIAAYTTYGSGIDKLQLYYGANINLPATPLLLYNFFNKTPIKHHTLFNVQRGHPSFNSIWPYYYITEDIASTSPGLDDIPDDSSYYNKLFSDKIIFIGNFEADKVNTPVGSMPGTLVIANTYLTLLKDHHIVSYTWLLLLLLVYTILSYIAWFKKMPEINFKFRFIFSKHFSDFLKGYISYFGVMLVISLLSFFLFNIFVNILFSALIFSIIEYFTNKKYKPNDA